MIKFSKNCGTFAIKESGGVKFQLWNFKRMVIIINYHKGSGKPRKFSRSRITKRTAVRLAKSSDPEKFRQILRQSEYFTNFWVINHQ